MGRYGVCHCEGEVPPLPSLRRRSTRRAGFPQDSPQGHTMMGVRGAPLDASRGCSFPAWCLSTCDTIWARSQHAVGHSPV